MSDAVRDARLRGYRASKLAVTVRVAAASGDPLRAARLFGAADHILDELSMVMEASASSYHPVALAAAREGVDPKSWRAAWSEGLALEPRAALALKLLRAGLQAIGTLVKDRPARPTHPGSKPKFPRSRVEKRSTTFSACLKTLYAAGWFHMPRVPQFPTTFQGVSHEYHQEQPQQPLFAEKTGKQAIRLVR